MSKRAWWLAAGGAILVTTLAAQMPWRVYTSMEPYDDIPLPADYQAKTDWVFARLMYPQNPNGRGAGRGFRRGNRDWRQGGTSWTQDYPRADRHFATALRRLTRLDVRSVEQPVNLDDEDDVYNWPWLAAGEMGDWLLTAKQAAKLRDYLLRGGFLYLDDFWGPQEWASFEESMQAVFPDREIIEIDNADQIFHSMFNLDDRYQILGQWALNRRGGMYNNRVAGTVAEWKGIRDDKNRLVVAMSFNSDVGDSWEFADDPNYPDKYSELGIRIGVNYVMYSITHRARVILKPNRAGLMRYFIALLVGFLGLAAWSMLEAQKPFKEWPAIEYENFRLPPDGATPHEWVRARLRYPDITGYPQNAFGFAGYWTMDYPRSDRHLLEGVRRLTRIDVRSLEQVTELDHTDDIYNWPMLYGVEVGHWDLPQDQADQLRDYLLRGGFLMVDDFHADQEWRTFVDSLERVLPGRPVVDIPNNDPIFHTIYDLNDRVQIPGAQYLQTGRVYEKDESGKGEHWRAVYDDKGRIIVAICHNMDLGDAWEWSDDPRYSEKWAGLAYRIAMNYFVYDLTH